MQFIKNLLIEIREVSKDDLAINREIYDKIGDAIKMLDEPAPVVTVIVPESPATGLQKEEGEADAPAKPTREWLNSQNHFFLKRAYNVPGDKSMTKDQIIEEILKNAA